MSKKSKAKEANRIAELLEQQQKYAQEIATQLAAAEAIDDDPSKKIVKLREMQDRIKKADAEISAELKDIILVRTAKRALKIVGVASAVSAAAITIPAVLGAVAVLHTVVNITLIGGAAGTFKALFGGFGMARKQKNELLKQNPGLGDFPDTIKVLGNRVSEMLAETLKNNSVEAFYGSNFYRQAVKYPPLHEIFDLEALGNKAVKNNAARRNAAPTANALYI